MPNICGLGIILVQQEFGQRNARVSGSPQNTIVRTVFHDLIVTQLLIVHLRLKLNKWPILSIRKNLDSNSNTLISITKI